MLRLILTDSISHAAKTVNEDLFDYNDQAAWIFDGATGIAKNTIPNANSDPQWLVQTINEELRRVWDDELPTRELLTKAAQNTIDRYSIVMGNDAPPLIERPTACLAMARLWSGALEISTLYDSGILYKGPERVLTFGCVGSLLAKEIHNERDRLITEGTSPDQLHDLLTPMERKFRALANVDGGYNIVDLTTRWVDRLDVQTVDAQPGDKILITTDGLYRLIDVFSQYNAASLVEAATEKSLNALYDELRDIEILDSACSEFPRAKIHDDVAAALISIV